MDKKISKLFFCHCAQLALSLQISPSDTDMRATISLESLWQTIQSLSLQNKEWLSSKLIENIREETEYISKKEILDGIKQGLLDIKEDRANGVQTKTLQEVIDEL